MFSNKLFRSYNLTNEQKSKVIDSLDRTNTVREVKLVYSTLAESMKFATNSPKKSAKPMAEGASRVQTSTKPTAQKAIVSEENLEQGYGSTGFWNYVSADMHMDLSTWYAATLIDEAFDYMVDLHDEDRAAEINMLEFV